MITQGQNHLLYILIKSTNYNKCYKFHVLDSTCGVVTYSVQFASSKFCCSNMDGISWNLCKSDKYIIYFYLVIIISRHKYSLHIFDESNLLHGISMNNWETLFIGTNLWMKSLKKYPFYSKANKGTRLKYLKIKCSLCLFRYLIKACRIQWPRKVPNKIPPCLLFL